MNEKTDIFYVLKTGRFYIQHMPMGIENFVEIKLTQDSQFAKRFDKKTACQLAEPYGCVVLEVKETEKPVLNFFEEEA